MPAELPARDWPSDGRAGVGGTAVVVEDHLILRFTIAELLEGLGYAVRTASNGFSGLRLVRRVEPNLVVLDLMMPDLAGQDVLAALREDPRTAGMPVLVVTGLPRALAHIGADEHLLPKPFTYDAFVHAVHTVAAPDAGPSGSRAACHPPVPLAPARPGGAV